MIKPKKLALALGLVAMTMNCVSCGVRIDRNNNNYTRAIRSGFKKIPESMQIETCFGEADHFISYSGPNVPQNWNTDIFIYGKYELTMQVVVRTDPGFSDIVEV